MKTVDFREAKNALETDLSRPLDRAVEGEPFVIARAGKPIVKVRPRCGTAPRLDLMELRAAHGA